MKKLFSLIITGILALIATSASAQSYYGVFKPGGYLIGSAGLDASVFLNGQPIPVSRSGMYLAGFGRDAFGNQRIEIRQPHGVSEVIQVNIGTRSYKKQKINGIKSNFVSPQAEDLKRIQSDQKKVNAARNSRSERDDWLEPFVWPSVGRITGVYGPQRILNGKPRAPHYGIDIAAPAGTPVIAPAGGKIVLADELLLSGRTVIIDHGNGISSTLMHLQSIMVTAGQEVLQGEKVATLGSTGRSTGPHLDWRINWNSERLDPQAWVPEMSELCEINGLVGGGAASSDRPKEAVVLLHGLGRKSDAMNKLSMELTAQGYEVCNQEYPSTKQSIEHLSGYLANSVQKLKSEGYETVHLVTHSMGGILARYYLQGKSLPGNGRIVMLSPPNQGSEIIDRFGRFQWFESIMGPAALQLSTQSSLLVNRLKPLQSDLGIIAGNKSSDPWFNFLFDQPHDGKVRVQSAMLEEMDDFVVVERGHTRIMDAPEVIEFVLKFLKKATFVDGKVS